MFQSRRFWFSYRLRVVGDEDEDEAEVMEFVVLLVGVVIIMLVASIFEELITS